MRARLLSVYGAMRNRIAPGLRYSQAEYEDLLRDVLRPGFSWLDVGCGHQVLPPWRGSAELDLVGSVSVTVGLDGHLPSIRAHRSIEKLVNGTISSLPFRTASFDLVTANMVVEHLGEPELQFIEMARVLKPNGILVLHTPNARGYPTRLARSVPDGLKKRLAHVLDGRDEDDVFPTFYRANTVERISEIAAQAGMELDAIRLICSEAMLAIVPPLAFFELFAIRALMTSRWEAYRPNMLVVLRRRPDTSPGSANATAPVIQ